MKLNREEIITHEVYWRTLKAVQSFLEKCKDIDPPEIKDISNPDVAMMASVLVEISDYIEQLDCQGLEAEDKRITVAECSNYIDAIAKCLKKYENDGVEHDLVDQEIYKYLEQLEVLVKYIPTSYIATH